MQCLLRGEGFRVSRSCLLNCHAPLPPPHDTLRYPGAGRPSPFYFQIRFNVAGSASSACSYKRSVLFHCAPFLFIGLDRIGGCHLARPRPIVALLVSHPTSSFKIRLKFPSFRHAPRLTVFRHSHFGRPCWCIGRSGRYQREGKEEVENQLQNQERGEYSTRSFGTGLTCVTKEIGT